MEHKVLGVIQMHFVQGRVREVSLGLYPFFGSDESLIVSIGLWSDEVICGFDYASMAMHVTCIHLLKNGITVKHSRT
jgi:hypothetical protein